MPEPAAPPTQTDPSAQPSPPPAPGAAPPPPPAAPGAQLPIPGAGAPPPPVQPAPMRTAKEPYIRMPQADFKARVQREARGLLAEQIQAELGCSLEEAKAVLATRRAAAGGAPAQGVDPGEALPKNDARVAELEGNLTTVREELDQLEKAGRKTSQRHKDEMFVMQLKITALKAGIDEKHHAFAINQYREMVLSTPEGQKPATADEFFASMRKEQPYLSSAGAPAAAAPGTPPQVVPIHPTTAPPESPTPGGGPPPPKSPGQRQEAPNAEKMSDREFAEHSSSRYGYRPGTY